VAGEELGDPRPVAHLEPDADPWILPTKRRQYRRNHPLPCGRHRRQAERADFRIRLGPGGARRFLEQTEQPPRVVGENRPGVGEPKSAAVAFDERDAELATQRGEHGRDGGLADEQRLGCRVDRAGLRHGEEGPKLAWRHT
jgi:hypothetical protein